MTVNVLNRRLWLLACLLAILTVVSPFLKGQSTYGSIVGTVTDISGAAVPGATVTVTNLGTGEARKVQSDTGGNFSVVNLLPAIYKVESEKSGFKRNVLPRLDVAVGTTVRKDMVLAVGAVTETVEVTTQAPLLQTDSGTLSTTVEGTTVQEMPLNGRNVMNLLALAAGVVPQGSTSGGTANGLVSAGHTSASAWSNYAIGGGISGGSAMYIDGASVNMLGMGNGNSVSLVMTQDAVQEFNVVANNQTADWGRNGGGVVNMASKSGTNSFHGSVYEYFRNAALNANEFWNKKSQLTNGQQNKPPKYNQNQYGVAIGGPILKDRAFFHFTWEGFQGETAFTTPAWVPTSDMQNGTFAQYIADPVPLNGSACGIQYYDASGNSTTPNSNGSNVAKSVIPKTCWDPLAAIIKAYYPSPTQAAVNSAGYNYYWAPLATNKQNQYNGRVDYTLSNKQRIFGRYTWWDLADNPNDYLQSGVTGWNTAASYGVNYARQIVAGDTYTFSPNTILDVRLSYLRDYQPNGIPQSLGQDLSKLATTPTNYLTNLSSQFNIHMLPFYSLSGSDSKIASAGKGGYSETWADNYAFSVNLIHIMGKHSLKIGGEARLLQTYSRGGNTGSFTFDNSYTNNDWASFLLGYAKLANRVGGSLSLSIPTDAYNYYQAYYITDTWQTTHKLTLNLGLRYELPGGVFEKHNNNNVLLPSYQWSVPSGAYAGQAVEGILALVNSPLYSPRTSVDMRHDLLAPRLGFAYRLGSNMAVRGGYGLSYLAIDDNMTALMPSSSAFNASTTSCGSTSSTQPDANQRMYNCFNSTNLVKPLGRTLNSPSYMTANYVNQPGKSISGVVPNQKPSYVQQWNLTVSRQFKGDFMLELGYAGTKGTELPFLGSPAPNVRGMELNQIPDGYYDLNGYPLVGPDVGKSLTLTTKSTAPACAAFGWTVGQCLRPNPAYGNIYSVDSHSAGTIYHGMQLKAEKRFKSGSVIMGNYVWSKTMGNTDSNTGGNETKWNPPGPGAQAGVQVQDYYNLRAERSVLTYDVPQRAVISYVLALPFGNGQKWGIGTTGAVSRVISGWSVNGITSFQHGFHVGFSDQGTPSGSGLNNTLFSSFGAGGMRPNAVAGCNKLASLSGSYTSRAIAGLPQFNTSCWSAPANYSFGNAPRTDPNVFSMGIDNWDFSAMKATNITERVNIQFRAEFFNISNREQFSPPATVQDVSGFGVIGWGANLPRLVQFSLRVNY